MFIFPHAPLQTIMRKSFIQPVFWIALLSLSQCTMTTISDEQSIRQARHDSNQAIAAHQIETVGTFWTDDYHIITSRNAETSGKAANIERFQNEVKAKPDVIYIRTPQTIHVFSQWKMASEEGSWEGRWSEDGSVIQLKGTYFAKWHQVNGSWLIRAEIFVPLSCEGGLFCERGPLD